MARQHYSISMRSGRHGLGRKRQHSFQWERLVIVALLAALAVTLFVCLPSMSYRNESRSLFISRLQTECDTAITSSKYLSRTASSNSNAQLAMIRSSIYSMDVINQTYASLEGEGKHLVEQNVFSSLYSTLDNYFSKLTTGMNTSDQLTDLSNQLEQLKKLVADLD